ncbi:hypothetical protein [Burkholderia cepacia]|uniref:hypothetical protein n=1 Tax=Burkholderia cepacia TaxID=292 RepID=UPI0012D96B5E|nr:hypothetical protein [Burkholderia cepacia]
MHHGAITRTGVRHRGVRAGDVLMLDQADALRRRASHLVVVVRDHAALRLAFKYIPFDF